MKVLWQYVLIYVTISAVSAVLSAIFFGHDAALSYLVGSLTMGFVLAIWVLTFLITFLKKFVAMAVLAIVIKYVVLVLILSNILTQSWFILAGFCVGILTFAPAGLIVGWNRNDRAEAHQTKDF